jgi:hypothetical protein
LEEWATENPESYKQNLMGSSGGSLEQSVNGNAESKGKAFEVSDRNEDSIGNGTRGHSCYIVAKKLSTFCP